MIIPAAAAAFLSIIPAFGAVTAGRGGGGGRGAGRGAGRGTMPTMAGVAAEHLCPTTGLIKSWKAASQEDTDMLKQLVEEGFIDGYRTQDVKDEHPRYNRFTNKCLGDKVSNLRRTFRDNIERRAQMDAAGGGGQGLAAQDAYVPPIEQPRGNYYVDDEADDHWPNENDDITETMSRMTMDDGASFASHSVTNQTRGGVSFVSGAAGGRPPARSGASVGSVRSGPPPRAGGILRNPNGRGRGNAVVVARGTAMFNGGSVCTYSVHKWIDEHTIKRWSVHVQMISGENVPLETTARVTSDQRHLLLEVPLSECFLDTDRGLFYLYDRVKFAFPYIDTVSKFREFIKNHPRQIAMKRNILKLKEANPTADRVMFPVRISLGGKVAFDCVDFAEDPICYGKEFIVDHLTGECHYYLELKEEKKNGFTGHQANYAGDIRSPEPPTAPVIRTNRDMDAIPEEVSIDSRNSGLDYTPNSRTQSLNGRLDAANAAAARRRSNGGSVASDYSGRTEFMSVDSNTPMNGRNNDAFDEYLENVETELLNDINNRPNTDASVYTESSSVRMLKSPRKKPRATEFTFEERKPPARTDLTVAVSVKNSRKRAPSGGASVASASSRRASNTVTPAAGNGNTIRHSNLPINSDNTPAAANLPSAASVATTATGRPKRKAAEKKKKHGSGNNSDDYTV